LTGLIPLFHRCSVRGSFHLLPCIPLFITDLSTFNLSVSSSHTPIFFILSFTLCIYSLDASVHSQARISERPLSFHNLRGDPRAGKIEPGLPCEGCGASEREYCSLRYGVSDTISGLGILDTNDQKILSDGAVGKTGESVKNAPFDRLCLIGPMAMFGRRGETGVRQLLWL
jgi:hypothetical protein